MIRNRGSGNRWIIAVSICCVLIVGSAGLVESTDAAFTSSITDVGTVAIDDDPALNYQIMDQSSTFGARYSVQYQVEWVKDFKNISVRVINVNDSSSTMYRNTSKTGAIRHPSSGFYDINDDGDLYQFTFEVYQVGNSTPVITKQTTDFADGSNQGDGNFSRVGDPTLDNFTVLDQSTSPLASYDVEYEIGNVTNESLADDNLQEVRVTFDNLNISFSQGITNTSTAPNGTISYSIWGMYGDTYEITIEVVNDDGLIVDTVTVVDPEANGEDP